MDIYSKIDFKVCIQCMTFNHAQFIEDAMNGFSIQETNFPFVAVIMDDASKDGEPEIIKQYLHEHFDLENKEIVRNEETDDYIMTFARHKENHNCYFAVYLLKYNHYSIKKGKEPYYKEFFEKIKYVALCEGDDYWIAEDKLQRQVSFLDSNEEYGMVYTDYDQKNEITGTYTKAMLNNGYRPIIKSFEEHLVNKGYIAPMSWVYRKKYKDISMNYNGPNSIDESFIFALEMFLATKIYYEPTVTCIYRVHIGSATNQTNPMKRDIYSQGVYDTQMYYLKKYNLQEKYPSCCDYYYRSYYCYFLANNNTEMYQNIKGFFKREMNKTNKYFLFYHLMNTRLGTLLLQLICKTRLSKTFFQS